MNKHARLILLSAVILPAGLCLLLVAGRLLYPPRTAYQTLERNVYFPSFFPRLADARREGAGWVKNARTVALAYVATARGCDTESVREHSAGADRTVFTITRVCPYRVAPIKQFRIDLVRRDGFWEIEWAGLRLKCAANQNRLGAFLIEHTTSQSYGWVLPVFNVLKSSSGIIDRWTASCL